MNGREIESLWALFFFPFHFFSLSIFCPFYFFYSLLFFPSLFLFFISIFYFFIYFLFIYKEDFKNGISNFIKRKMVIFKTKIGGSTYLICYCQLLGIPRALFPPFEFDGFHLPSGVHWMIIFLSCHCCVYR